MRRNLKADLRQLEELKIDDGLPASRSDALIDSGRDWYFRAIDDVITDLLSTELIDLL